MSVIGQCSFTYTCNSCGANSQQFAVIDGSGKGERSLFPHGWVSFPSSDKSGKGHLCSGCREHEKLNSKAAFQRLLDRSGYLPIVEAVMSWREAFVKGDEDEAAKRCDDVFSAAATLVLGEEGLKEAGKLHDAAIDERERQLYGRNSRRWDPDCPKVSEQFPSTEDE